MLKSAKGETSVGLIIGLVVLVIIIIGAIAWSRSNKSADLQGSADVPVNTQSATTTTTGTTTSGTPTTTTTTATVPVTDPTLPQTGMGPEGK